MVDLSWLPLGNVWFYISLWAWTMCAFFYHENKFLHGCLSEQIERNIKIVHALHEIQRAKAEQNDQLKDLRED